MLFPDALNRSQRLLSRDIVQLLRAPPQYLICLLRYILPTFIVPIISGTRLALFMNTVIYNLLLIPNDAFYFSTCLYHPLQIRKDLPMVYHDVSSGVVVKSDIMKKPPLKYINPASKTLSPKCNTNIMIAYAVNRTRSRYSNPSNEPRVSPQPSHSSEIRSYVSLC